MEFGSDKFYDNIKMNIEDLEYECLDAIQITSRKREADPFCCHVASRLCLLPGLSV
jgi:hypothetical protein